MVGLGCSVVMAADINGGSVRLVPSAIAGVALVLLGWLAGENTRAGRVYAAQQAERAAEKTAAAAAERAEQVRRAPSPQPARSPRELHRIRAPAVGAIAGAPAAP